MSGPAISFCLCLSIALASAGAEDPVVFNDGMLDARIAASTGKLPHCLSRFLDYPPGNGKSGFRPNPDFWLKGIDLTCASPWNDSYGRVRAGTAISRRHIVCAKHFPLAVGTRIAFVGETGEVSHYSVTATKAHETCDIMVGLLDYELTPDIHPAKVLPADFEKWIPVGTSWPLLTLNQDEKAFLSHMRCLRSNVAGHIRWLNKKLPKQQSISSFGGGLTGGDSGNPAFLLYRGRPILLFCVLSGGAGDGPKIHEFRGDVQRMMDDLCPGYVLENFDFRK